MHVLVQFIDLYIVNISLAFQFNTLFRVIPGPYILCAVLCIQF